MPRFHVHYEEEVEVQNVNSMLDEEEDLDGLDYQLKGIVDDLLSQVVVVVDYDVEY